MRCKVLYSTAENAGPNLYLIAEVDSSGGVVGNPMYARTNNYEDVTQWRPGAGPSTEVPLPYPPVAAGTVVRCEWPRRRAAAERFLQVLEETTEGGERRTLTFDETTRALTPAEDAAAWPATEREQG